MSDAQSTELAEIRERLAGPVTREEFKALDERVRYLESLVEKVQTSLSEALENPMVRQMCKNFGIEF